MTHDELRALADAIVYRDPLAIARVSDYLRAQADAQPVPVVPVVPDGWKLVPVEPTEEWLEVGRKAIEDVLIEWRDDRLSELGRGNGCVIRERDGTPSNVIRFGPETALRIGYKAMLAAAPAAPQAEPKREPSCLWSRADDDTDVWETKCGHAFTIIDGTPTDNQMAFCCYCGRRVDEEIGGSDAE